MHSLSVHQLGSSMVGISLVTWYTNGRFSVFMITMLSKERVKCYTCDNTPPNTSTSSNHFNLGQWSSSGSDRGITHFFMATRNTIKGVRGKNNEQTNNMAWVSSKCKKRSYVILPSLSICRLTLAWISCKISTKLLGMPTHPDWSSLTDAGLSLMPTGLFCCPVSTANCPSPSPVTNCLLWVPSSNSSLVFPCLLPVVSRSQAQAFVWFRTKTDKGIICLADHSHSVTYPLTSVLL